MGNRAALAAVFVLGACGGGSGKATTTVKPDTTTKPVAPPKPAPPPKPQPVPVDVATLEVWAGNVDGGPVVVAAADVDAEILRRVVVPNAIEIISVHTDALLTGRVAGSRVGVLSALTGVNPALKLGPRVKLAGKGPSMIIDQIGTDVRELFAMFADALGTNIVVLAPPQKLTVSANLASTQKLVDAVVKIAGLVTEKPVAGVLVVRARSQPKIGKLPAKGAKIDLDVRGARPGHVLGLVRGVTGGEAPTGACTAGEPTTVRLEGVPSGAVEKLVEALGGDAKVTACALTPVTDPDLATLTLVASAKNGAETLWLAMDGDKAVVFDREASWPAATADARGDDSLAEARLAATINGIGRDVAIVEVGGRFRVLEPLGADADGKAGVVKVGLGEIEVADATGARRTLRLSKRPK